MAVARGNKVRLKDRRRRESYLSSALIAAVIVLLLGGVAYASRLPAVTIQTVTVEGAVQADATAIQTAVEMIIDGTYVLLIPKRMTYTVPRGALSAALVEAFPEVGSATVTKRDDNELIVSVTEREAKALWCSDSCYKMDAYGFVFDEAPSTVAGLRRYEGLMTEPIGKTFLDGGFQDFDALVDQLEQVSRRTITQVMFTEVDVFLTLKEGGELRFTRDRNAQQLLADVIAVFSSDEFQNEKELDYVELRFGKNAVVKFRD